VVVAAVHDGFEWNEEQLAVERAEIMDVVDTLYRYSSVMLASIIPTVS
jgi:ferric-dicitrate binding protein FerR (iron transport regulator)